MQYCNREIASAGRAERKVRRDIGLGMSATALLVVFTAVPAIAQSNETNSSAVTNPQDGAFDGLAEIVVTARQRSENMQETPLSISAVDGQTLVRMQTRSLTDLDAKVPSLQFGNTSVRLQTYTGIRGVGDYSRNPGYDNRAGIYLDGVLMGRSAATDYPVFDIAQVEVLRGPQGTLFGKDALTGVINITSIKPRFKDEMQARISVGSRELISGSAVVNTSLSDKVAVRMSISGRGQRGYYRNRFDNSTAGGGVMFGGRGQIRWVPNDRTTIDFSFDGVRDDADVILGGTPLAGPGLAFTDGGRNFSQNYKPQRLRKIYGSGLNIDHKMGDYTLTSITGYRASTNRLTGNDIDLSPLDISHNDFYDKSRAFSEEVRLASPGDAPFNYVIGGFYYDQVASSDWLTLSGPASPIALTLRDQPRVSTRILAGFGHATWKATDWLTLDGGLRVNNTRKSIHFVQTTNGTLGYINLNYNDSLTKTDVSPLASVTVTPVDDVHAYATFSTGQRPGGWNADLVKTTSLRFGSESAKNYEVGLKTELFDRHLRLNISGYIMKFKDFQVTQLLPDPVTNFQVSILTNAGRVTSKGIEADVDAALFPGFNLVGGVGYNRAVYDTFRNGGGAGIHYDGNTLPEAPRWTASGTASYAADISDKWRGSASLTYTYKDATFADPSNQPRVRQDKQHLLNGEIALSTDGDAVRVAVFGRNLANVKFRQGAFFTGLGYNYVAFNEPRVIGVELSIKR